MPRDRERYRAWKRAYYALHREKILAQDRERKLAYGRPCLDCGKITDGSNGRDRAPLRCITCFNRSRTIWTQEAIVAAIQRFAKRYGAPPTAAEWNPTMARRVGRDDWSERYYRDGDYPITGTVQHEFGSWNAGIAAAGFTPRAPGMRGPDRERVA